MKKKIGIFLTLLMLVMPLVSFAGLLNSSDCRSEWGINCSSGATDINGLVAMIIDIVLSVAGLIAVLFVIYGGYQYIFSAGNDETAEKGKKTLTNAIIGIVIIIFSFVIIRAISNIFSGSYGG
jgi:hypothetical protein